MKPESASLVFVVDDDPAILHSTRFFLECEGHAVETFHDGPTLLATFPGPHPDLVLLDYIMPGMDGLEVAERLRALDVRVRTVLITGHLDPAIRARAQAVGIPVLDKPLALQALLGMLAAYGPRRGSTLRPEGGLSAD